MTYRPSAFVFVVSATFVRVFTSWTWTSGTTCPLGSVIRPETVAVSDCANVGTVSAKNTPIMTIEKATPQGLRISEKSSLSGVCRAEAPFVPGSPARYGNNLNLGGDFTVGGTRSRVLTWRLRPSIAGATPRNQCGQI